MNDPKVISIFPDELDEATVHMYVSEAAYYKAEKRGFEPGYELQDWLAAEQEIESCLGEYFDSSYFSEVAH